MENSMSSSMNKALYSKEGKSSEESGWTWYFEDFMEKREEEDHDHGNSSTSVCVSSSMVSDAASYAAWKSSAPVEEVAAGCCNSLSFKKRKTGVMILDDDQSLEDTASSPVNSPKVSELSQRRKDDKKDVSDEKDSIHGLDFNERTNECTELQKRGLCLVPLSMFLNYF